MTDESDKQGAEVRQALRRLATAVSDERLELALVAYEDARVDGLCHEGAWERAVEAMRGADDAVSLLDNQH